MRIHGLLFRELELFWLNLRKFFQNQKTLFDMLFLLLYSIEQAMLFVLIIIFPEDVTKIVGGFIIVFLTTMGFERLCMESRYTSLKERIMIIEKEYYNLNEENRWLRIFIRGTEKRNK